jgi:hypothetical protein
MNDVVVVLTLIAALTAAAAALVVAKVVSTRPPVPPGPAVEPIVPLLATLHDELATVRRELADVATAISIFQDARESSLLKQNSDLHDRIMVIMSPSFLREFRRQAVTPEERTELLRARRLDLDQERATRRIHYPGFEPDLRPRVRPGGIESIVKEDASARRGVMAESFDDLPDDRSSDAASDAAPDASTPEGALAAARRSR